MQFNPYLFFKGDCETAFNFYAELLGGKVEAMITNAGAPAADTVPPEWRNKIIHARLSAKGQVLMGSDAPPGHFEKPQGFYVTISATSIEEAERLFMALAKDGHIRMPIQETFFAERFAMLIDRFGTPWMINFEKKP